eukprot:gene5617-4036_t
MSAAATLAAAQACARTLLFDSTHLERFTGAVPHVMLIVDALPCALQKTLVEGYRRALDGWAGTPTGPARADSMLIPLTAGAPAPCGSAGLLQSPAACVSYSVAPFAAATFMSDVEHLQTFLRQCGGGSAPAAFREAFDAVAHLLQPLGGAPVPSPALCEALRCGPSRELLAFVLIQRSAFQNELQQYRLRLRLFDRGMRVVEHCHLHDMSAPADRHAAAGDVEAALCEDQVFSYCRSCAFRPSVAEPFARAIADAIDANAWERDGDGAALPPPPPTLGAALQRSDIWECFDPDLFTYGGVAGSALAAQPCGSLVEFEERMRRRVTGVGAPLRIQCRDPSKALVFTGGMEDCLTNTGFYTAALDPARNDAAAHRVRFRLEAPDAAPPLEAPSAAVHGRMKKRDYIAMCRQTGQKPNKPGPSGEEDHQVEEGMSRRAGPEEGSRMSSSIGGTFPIGEVISESFDLAKLNGVCDVFAYPDTDKNVAFARPAAFEIVIDAGRVVSLGSNAPADFVDLWSLVRQTEQECYVRELGIGLNPYVGLQHILADVTSFERQWGVHLSLGLRHPLFVKQNRKRNADGTPVESVKVDGPVVKRRAGKYHIDVFVDAASISCGAFKMDFTTPIRVS